MIPEILGNIVRREGRKFRRLNAPDKQQSLTAKKPGIYSNNISLYVHIPFCRSLCPFCCFNRYLFDEGQARRYFSDLKNEIALYREQGYNFTSIYFGGGTPTILMDELLFLIDYLRSTFDVKEISLETTPRELTEDNIKLLTDAGINRLSIGVQSFEDRVLKTMGRNNGPADEVKRRLTAVQGKFDTLNVDFVFNFPGQSIDEFERDVTAFKELELDQATFYPLMASPHKHDALERKFNRVDNSRERQFFNIIMRELYHDGYTPSTVWCYSRGEHMIDEYIVNYSDYIGVGAGSVSIAGNNFYVNTFSLDKYHIFAENKSLPIIGVRRLSERENMRYFLLTKLFGISFDKSAFREKFGNWFEVKMAIEMGFFKTAGFVKGNELLTVTEKGMYPVSVMMREFFSSLNTLREYCIENQI